MHLAASPNTYAQVSLIHVEAAEASMYVRMYAIRFPGV